MTDSALAHAAEPITLSLTHEESQILYEALKHSSARAEKEQDLHFRHGSTGNSANWMDFSRRLTVIKGKLRTSQRKFADAVAEAAEAVECTPKPTK